MTIVKQPHWDTRKLTDDVKAALKESEASLPADVVIQTELFQRKSFIDRGVYFVEEECQRRFDLVVKLKEPY